MKINKEELKRLCEKSDAELWQIINEVAAKHGYDLPKSAPKNGEMNKIRAILGDSDKINMREAMRLMQEYKRRG